MTDSPRNIDWPWTVGGTNDGMEVSPGMFRDRRPFLAPKGLLEPGEVDEEAKLEQETYKLRQITTPGSGLRITYFAESELTEAESTALIWERICARALIDARLQQVIPDAEELANALREGANYERCRSTPDLKLAETMLKTAQIIGLIPICPQCQGWLIHRRPDQRFMEANNYVQCWRGHTFELVPGQELPGGKTASQIIKLVIEGHAPQLVQALER